MPQYRWNVTQFAAGYDAASVAPQVYDQTVLRDESQEPLELGNEQTGSQIEGADPNVSERAVLSLDIAKLKDFGEDAVGREAGAGGPHGLRGDERALVRPV